MDTETQHYVLVNGMLLSPSSSPSPLSLYFRVVVLKKSLVHLKTVKCLNSTNVQIS